MGRRVIGISDLVKKPWWKWYLTPVVNFGEVRRGQLAKWTLLTSTLVPLGSFQILRSVQMLNREWGAESNGKLLHCTYSIPGKTVALVPEFVVEDMPSAEMQPRFLRLQWRTCPWTVHLMMMMNKTCYISMGAKGDWNFWISDLIKILKELVFNPYGEFRWSPDGPVSQIHSHFQGLFRC